MKKLLKMVLEAIISILWEVYSEADIRGMIKELVVEKVQKSITPEELKNEAGDLKKLLKDKWNL